MLNAKFVKKISTRFTLPMNMSDNDVSSNCRIETSIPPMNKLQRNQIRIGESVNNHITVDFDL